MGESKARKAWEERISNQRRRVEEEEMNGIPVVCSKCQGKLTAIPGTAHEECGGTFVPVAPQGQELKFSNPVAMQIFMMLDRLVNDTSFLAGQFNFMRQPNLAQTIAQLTKMAQQLRDTFYQQDQSRIIIAGPSDLPRNGEPKS